jgi:hypothetical protein
MTTAALLQTLSKAGVRCEVEDGQLRVVGPPTIVTPAMRQDLKARREEILAILSGAPQREPHRIQEPSTDHSPIVEDGRRVRWTLADERGLPRCRSCGGPIRFWKVTEDSDGKDVGRWWITDPDDMRHACGGPRAGRFIDPDTAGGSEQ